MDTLRRYFFIFSILLAAVCIALILRESRTAWKPYQQRYRSFLEESAGTAAEKKIARQFVPGVRQDWLPTLSRADRCRSCHIGVDNPAAPDVQPLSPHDDIDRHPPAKFGCTICHGGRGYATRLPDAHREMVPVRAMESSCGKCHRPAALAEQAPTYSTGSKLIERYNCNGCHLFADRGRRKHAGPDLTGVAGKVSRHWLSLWLGQPERYLPRARMPNFLLKATEIRLLSDFLLGNEHLFKGADQFYADSAKEEKVLAGMDMDGLDALADEGKIIFARLRCLTCHKLHGRGGSLAPELEKIAAKSNRKWLHAWLKSPSLYDPQTIMPAFTMTAGERLAVVEYLLWESEVEDDEAEIKTEPAGSPAQLSAENQRQGMKLFVEKGCYNCHLVSGVAVKNNFAPSLADFADKKIRTIDFRKTTIAHTAEDYVAAKLQAPRIFGDKLKMPLFNLTPVEIGRITTVILGQTTRIPESLRHKNALEPTVPPLGDVGGLFARYRCLSCHRIGANGGDLAPDLTYEGSKVKRQWLIAYLQKPYAIRPFLVARMPRFNMNPAEAALLADYITMVLRNRKIDSAMVGDQGDPEYGKKLYVEKYDCRKCHPIGRDGGYFGPPLDSVGSRLTRSWMSLRLQNAHAIEPQSREPVLAIPPADRDHLLLFLQSLTGEL